MPGAQATTAPTAPGTVVPAPDPAQGGFMDNSGMVDFVNMDFSSNLASDNVLEAFDFDSFLHDGEADGSTFDFTQNFNIENEIGAD
jgi:hypothetical protein